MAALTIHRDVSKKTNFLLFNYNSKNLSIFDLEDHVSHELHFGKPSTTMTSLSVVNVDGVVYVLGPKAAVYKLAYNACGNAVWNAMGSTKTFHGNHPPMSVLSGCIYIVGSNDNYYKTKEVEKYNPATNVWLSIGERPNMLLWAETLGIGRFIYSFGGIVDGAYVSEVTRFDETGSTQQWTVLAPMNKERANVCAAEWSNMIYVAGGLEGDSKSFEKYDIASNAWTTLSPTLHPRSWGRLFAFEDCLYAVGGIYSTDSIEKYSIERNEWKTVIKDGMLNIENSVAIVCRKVTETSWNLHG